MALPGSGTIWLSQVQAEFGGANPIYMSEYYRNGPYVTDNNTGIPTGGTIYMSQFHGTVKSNPGTWERTADGSYTFTVPPYQTLRVRVWGGGGATVGGTAGTRSIFNGPGGLDVIGNPGATGRNVGENANGGGAGGTWSAPSGGSGGNGATGGSIFYYDVSARANAGDGQATYGGGSHGVAQGNVGVVRGLGGGGGYASYTFSVGQLAVGGSYTVTVGKGGTSPQGSSYNGRDGRVYINWT